MAEILNFGVLLTAASSLVVIPVNIIVVVIFHRQFALQQDDIQMLHPTGDVQVQLWSKRRQDGLTSVPGLCREIPY